MPKVLLETPDTLATVVRPLVQEIVQEILENTRAGEDVQIRYPGPNGRLAQANGTVDSSGQDNVTLQYGSQVWVEVDDEPRPDRMLENKALRPENIAIFRDEPLQIYVAPEYTGFEATLNFKYRAKDQVEAMKWRDNIRVKLSMNRQVFLHSASYSYILPEELILILKEIHRLREVQGGYGDTFDKWFEDNRSSNITWATNSSGEEGDWRARQTQIRIQGWFTFDGVPEKGQLDNDGNAWTISFQYRFHYDKPTELAFCYPLMIHNQLLSEKYRPTYPDSPPYRVEDDQRAYSASQRDFAYFEANYSRPSHPRYPGYAVPEFDEFFPAWSTPNTIRLFTMLVSITPEDKRTLFNLKTMGQDAGIELHPDMWCCMESEWPYMTKPFKSVFDMSLYSGPDIVEAGVLEMDANYNVFSTVDLDIRKTYHVRFSVHRKLNRIDPMALKRIQMCPDCLTKVLTAVEPSLIPAGIVPCRCINGVYPTHCLNEAINFIDRKVLSDHRKFFTMPFYTGNIFVTTHPNNVYVEPNNAHC